MKNNEIITQLTDDLRRIGVMPSTVLLVHASLKSLGNVAGGAETVVLALLNALGSNGTLLMPALSYRTVDANNPYFNQLETPSCVGSLPEYFRRRQGTLRSLHPTHSVSAYGKKAKLLLADHQLDTTPCGANSPFCRLPNEHGKILMLGCGMKPNTSMHAIEEIAQSPYVLKKNAIDYHITDANGKNSTMSVRRHNFADHYLQCYDRLEPLLSSDALQTNMILKAHCHLIDCQLMRKTALEKMAADPFYFVEPIGEVTTQEHS